MNSVYPILQHFPDLAYRIEKRKIVAAAREVFGTNRKLATWTSDMREYDEGYHRFIAIQGDLSDEEEWYKLTDVHEKIGLTVTNVVMQEFWEGDGLEML